MHPCPGLRGRWVFSELRRTREDLSVCSPPDPSWKPGGSPRRWLGILKRRPREGGPVENVTKASRWEASLILGSCLIVLSDPPVSHLGGQHACARSLDEISWKEPSPHPSLHANIVFSDLPSALGRGENLLPVNGSELQASSAVITLS